MKNDLSNALKIYKDLQKLSNHPCNGCIFNKIGTCSLISDINCTNKEFFISHQEFADFINFDFLHSTASDFSDSYIYKLKLLIKENKK